MNKNKKNSDFFLYDFLLFLQKSKPLLFLISFVMFYPLLEYYVLFFIDLDSFWKKFFYLTLVFFMKGPWFILFIYLLVNRLEAQIGIYTLLSMIFVFSFEGNYFYFVRFICFALL